MRPILFTLPALALVACAGTTNGAADAAEGSVQTPPAAGASAGEVRVASEVVQDFNEPWAMAFLPDGSALVTEKRGQLK